MNGAHSSKPAVLYTLLSLGGRVDEIDDSLHNKIAMLEETIEDHATDICRCLTTLDRQQKAMVCAYFSENQAWSILLRVWKGIQVM